MCLSAYHALTGLVYTGLVTAFCVHLISTVYRIPHGQTWRGGRVPARSTHHAGFLVDGNPSDICMPPWECTQVCGSAYHTCYPPWWRVGFLTVRPAGLLTTMTLSVTPQMTKLRTTGCTETQRASQSHAHPQERGRSVSPKNLNFGTVMFNQKDDAPGQTPC